MAYTAGVPVKSSQTVGILQIDILLASNFQFYAFLKCFGGSWVQATLV